MKHRVLDTYTHINCSTNYGSENSMDVCLQICLGSGLEHIDKLDQVRKEEHLGLSEKGFLQARYALPGARPL